MNKQLTLGELALMKGKYAGLARKYDVSTSYVKLIALGKRQVNSKLSRMIYEDIIKIVSLFTPLTNLQLRKLKQKPPYLPDDGYE